MRQISLKFPTIEPTVIAERVRRGTPEELGRWGDRGLTATRFEDVFG
ncbi:MAG: hypothetical protein AB7S26_32710 [Sandaracinaceae bacterium]